MKERGMKKQKLILQGTVRSQLVLMKCRLYSSADSVSQRALVTKTFTLTVNIHCLSTVFAHGVLTMVSE